MLSTKVVKVARVAREAFAQVDSDSHRSLEEVRVRALKEEVVKEVEVEAEAKAARMSNVITAESSAITKEIVQIHLYATIVGEKAINPTTAHTPRKMDRTHHHHLGKLRAKEKG